MKYHIKRFIILITIWACCMNSYAYDFEVDGLYYKKLSTSEVEVIGNNKDKYVGEIIIPEKVSYSEVEYIVSSIGNMAFYNCSELSGAISIPNTVKSIGSSAFYNCSGLTGELVIPSSVSTIGNSAFSGCSGLTGPLNIPSSVVSIGDWAFYNCSGLTGSLSIPQNVKTIGEYAFCQCSGFTRELSLPDGITEIGTSTFSGCSGLTGTLVIPNSVTCIGESAFRGCSGFYGKLNLPSSVTSIGNSAFISCSGITQVLIPNTTTSIGNWAFAFCKAINEVISEIDSPFDISGLVFYAISSNAILLVPKGTKGSYESFDGWIKNFKNIIEADTEISLSITANGYGTAYFGTTTIKNQTKSFSMGYGTSATISFIPDNGYKIGSVKLNNKDITSEVVDYTYTIKEIEDNVSIVVSFESISGTLYSLSINANGNGYAKYNGDITRQDANSYIVKAGSSPYISFVPDEGYRTAKILENNVDVTSKVLYNSYTVSNITKNTLISVWFEEKPVTTYSLSLKAIGNGSVTYDNMSLSNQSQTFTVNEGAYASLVFSPENGYRVKSVLVDNKDVTSEVKNNLYTISNITKNTTVEVEFEAIPIPTYTITVTAAGNGSATVGDATIKNKTQQFTLNEGTNVIVIFTPENGNSIKSVKVNDVDITASVTGNRHVIEGLTANTTIEVTFVEDVNALTVDGINYSVISQSEKTIKLMGGNIGQVLTVLATVTQNEATWKVADIDKEALKSNAELAAIIWEPEVAFTATVSNSNLLLYVKADQYAPASIKNVIVNGVASDIILDDAANGNDFYCPQTFTAQKISYSHHYGMETGIGTSKGWETIALPFDVQTITHHTKGNIVPFANWKEEDSTKPFWLYELTGSGFVEATNIKAYTPYVISMPNNPKYDDQWQLNGVVTFSANSVTIEKTEDLKTASFQDRTFVPNFANKAANGGFYALNVVNDYSSNNSGMVEGSRFVLNMRQIHPFEAYMTTTSNSSRAIGIFDDMTTAIHEIETKMEAKQNAVFDLQGRRMNDLKKGVYIKNGKKYIKK